MAAYFVLNQLSVMKMLNLFYILNMEDRLLQSIEYEKVENFKGQVFDLNVSYFRYSLVAFGIFAPKYISSILP